MAQRKHAELIKQIADDDSLEIEYLGDNGWVSCGITSPLTYPHVAHRIKSTKPSIDWSAHSFKWIATSSNGVSLLYMCKPEPVAGGWWVNPTGAPTLIADFLTSFKAGTCDWKDSLVQRPEVE